MDLRSSNKPAVLEAIMKVVKSSDEKAIAEQLAQNIIINEEKTNWDYSIKAYCEGESKENQEKVSKLLNSNISNAVL